MRTRHGCLRYLVLRLVGIYNDSHCAAPWHDLDLKAEVTTDRASPLPRGGHAKGSGAELPRYDTLQIVQCLFSASSAPDRFHTRNRFVRS
jgi:hypothetical protein